MKKLENGELRDMTEEEIAELSAAWKEAETVRAEQEAREAAKPFEQKVAERLGMTLDQLKEGLGVRELETKTDSIDSRLKAVEEKPEITRTR